MNEKTLFQGTGAAIAGLAITYAGMKAFCTSTGSGFTINIGYVRNTANDAWLTSNGITGEIKLWGGAYASVPQGFLLCDGAAVSRTTYATLFAVVSTNFGVGDGSTTFNVPNLQSKFPRGAPNATEAGGTGGEDTHALSIAELAVHSHSHTIGVSNAARQSGNGSGDDYLSPNSGTNGWWRPGTITGGISNTGSGTAHENKPPYVDVHFIIRVL